MRHSASMRSRSSDVLSSVQNLYCRHHTFYGFGVKFMADSCYHNNCHVLCAPITIHQCQMNTWLSIVWRQAVADNVRRVKYSQTAHIRRIKYQNAIFVSSRLAVVFAPTGDAPTTSEWPTISLPTNVRLIFYVWGYILVTVVNGLPHNYLSHKIWMQLFRI